MPRPVIGAVLSGGNDLGAEDDSASSGRTICGNANANVSSASVGRNASSCGFSRSRSGRVIDSDRGTRLLYGIGPGDPNASCFGKGPPILAGSRCDRHGRRHLVHAFRRYAGLQPAWDRDLVRSIPDSPLACHSDRRRRCRLCRRRTTPTGAARIRLRDGTWYLRHALHRHGRDANGGPDGVRSPMGCALDPDRDQRLGHCALARLSQPTRSSGCSRDW